MAAQGYMQKCRRKKTRGRQPMGATTWVFAGPPPLRQRRVRRPAASRRSRIAADRRSVMRCVSRARAFCRAPPHRSAQRRVGRREDVFVAKPAPRQRQQRARAINPQRFVFEEPRQPFADGGVERAQTQVLADAPLMCGDRLLPEGVGVDRLGVGAQLQGREPQDLPVDLEARLTWRFAAAMLAQTGVILAAVIGAAVAILRMLAS